MKIITWNINSVRLRLALIADLVRKHDPDVLCLQETKVQDADFPLEALRNMGFTHLHIRGEKSYNGMLIATKLPCVREKNFNVPQYSDARHLAVRFENGILLHNLYVPAGGDIPDIEANPKYAYKLQFVDCFRQWLTKNYRSDGPAILVGDLNIAPFEHDVWSHTQLRNVVSHTAAEIERLLQLKQEFGWIDVARHFIPESEKLYSWWSYRNRDWRASNRGRRLDHIWVTKPLTEKLAEFSIEKETRDWTQTSDHVPVSVRLNLQ